MNDPIPRIDEYIEELLPERHPLVIEMEKRARRENFPIIGPQVGAFLELFALAIGAKRIMELGSGFGYSAYWFARQLRSDGVVILTDFDEDNRKKALDYLRKMNLSNRIDYRVGNSLDLFAEEPGPLDIVFNDIDKEDYPKVIDLAFVRLRKGGLLITDNALWHGHVTADNPPDKATEGVVEFNRLLAEHSGFHSIIIPLRDGVSIALKL